MNRRTLLKSTIGGGVLLLAGSTAYAKPARSAANPMISSALEASNEADALRLLFGDARPSPSEDVKIVAPFLTSPGLPATVQVESSIQNATAIALISDQAERPLAAYVKLTGASCFFSARLILERTTQVMAYVQTDSELLRATRRVKVTRGGYGMHTNRASGEKS